MSMFLPHPGCVRLSLTASALALSCLPAWAQSSAPQLDPVVVTATRTPVPVSQVVADVTVITREDIERQASGTVVDLLSHVAGFQVARSGGPAADGNVFLRGGESRHIAVLVDGVRVDTQNTSGGASWQMLNLAQIERIEIVRGPVSALYGSDAISGVVQVFTKRGKGPASLDLGVSVGEWNFLKADAGLSGSAGMFDYAVSAARERSDGFSARTNFRPGTRAADRDGYTTEGGSVRLGFTPVKAHRIEAAATQQHLNSRYDASISSANDDRGIRDLRELKMQWSAQWLESWSSQVAAGQSVDRYATPLTGYLTQTHVDTASWLNEFKWGAHAVSTLLERREDTLQNSDLRAFAPQERHDDGLGLGYAWRAHGTVVQVNGRNDWDSEFGTHSTGTVAAGQDFADHWNVHASWGTGYRAPTLYQRFSRYGNPALQPESSRNAELGVRYRKDGAELGLTVYDNRVSNLISAPTGLNTTTTCAQSLAYCYLSTAKAHLKGGTLTGGVTMGPVRLSGSVDVGSFKNAATDTDLRRRARRQASLRLDTDLNQWTLGAQWQAVGRRFNEELNVRPLGGYTVLNVDALYRINEQWRALARIDNLGDKRYETVQTYGTTPRTAIIGVRWTPGL